MASTIKIPVKNLIAALTQTLDFKQKQIQKIIIQENEYKAQYIKWCIDCKQILLDSDASIEEMYQSGNNTWTLRMNCVDGLNFPPKPHINYDVCLHKLQNEVNEIIQTLKLLKLTTSDNISTTLVKNLIQYL